MKRIVIILLALTLTFTVLGHHDQRVTTVILVRHAEKSVDSNEDVPLSAAGEARANELARVLGGTHIDAIYTTQWIRTRSTAAPLAKSFGLEPIVVPSGKTYVDDLIARIRKDHDGKTVVVVGHSNTTRDVIGKLGIADAPSIADSQYDDLFIVTLAEGSAPRLVALRFGAVAR